MQQIQQLEEKGDYIRNILEEEFDTSVSKSELINMIGACQPVFDALGFTDENEDSRELRYAIIGTIAEYFESREE